MDNLRRLLGIMRMDRVPNARIRELWGVKNGLDERRKSLGLGLFRWITSEVCWVSGETPEFTDKSCSKCATSRSIGRSGKSLIYTVKDKLRKWLWMLGKQGECSVYDSNAWCISRG